MMEFRFVEYNPRRELRGKEAVRVAVIDENGEEEWLWMSKRDITNNIKLFGEHPELLKAKDAYKAGVRA